MTSSLSSSSSPPRAGASSRAGVSCRPISRLLGLLCLFAAFAGAGTLRAQNFAGSTVDIKGTTYTYNSSSSDGTHIIDYYDGPGYYQTVFTGTGAPGIASVSHGNDGYPDFNGFWTGSSYVDAYNNIDISSDSRYINGNYYTGSTLYVNYSLDGSGNVVSSSYATYNGGYGSFSVTVNTDGTGSISGVEMGVVFGGNWYVNNTQSLSDYRSYNGYDYQGQTATTTYSIVNNALVSDYSATYYSYNGGSNFYVHIGTDGNGEITGSVSGFVYNNTWYVNGSYSITGDYRSYNGYTFQGTTATNNYSIVNGVVVNDYNATYSSYDGGGWFSVHIGTNGNGEITGNVSGFIISGSWYVNSTYSISGDYRYYSGVGYQGQTASDYYYLDNGTVYHTYSASYNNYDGGGGGFSVYIGPNGMGYISGNVSGVVYNGSWLVNYGGELSGSSISPPQPIYDRYYSFVNGSYYVSYNADGSSNYSEYSNWSSDGSASFSISYNGSTGSLSGNDPNFGSFSGTYASNQWTCTTSRGSPGFAPATIYNPTTPVRWKSATIDFTGNVVDSYATDDNTFLVTIAGNLPATLNSSYYASVDVYTGGSHTYGSYYITDSTFYVGGYDLRVVPLTIEEIPHTQPVLGLASSSYWINGREVDWTNGSDLTDSDGFTHSQSDNYANSNTGDTLAMSVTYPAPGAGSVSSFVMHVAGITYHGTFDGSGFTFDSSSPSADVSTSNPIIVGGPQAFWLGSRFYGSPYGAYYVRLGSDSPYYYAGNNLLLKLEGSSGSFHVAGHDYGTPGRDFSFDFNGQAGAFTFTDADGTELGFAAANDATLLIPGSTPPDGFPPAVFIFGSSENYAFAGSAANIDGLGGNDAYYVLQHLLSGGSNGDGIRGIGLLRIHLDNGAVTLTQSDGSLPTGTYNTETHLFQSNHANPIPTPIYAVNPLDNNKPWGLATPPAELPATAVVGGQLWRFTDVGAGGTAHYVGAYSGQTLTMTPSTVREKVWDVVVTDPFGGNETGEFHNFTFSMNGATGVGSGDDVGNTVNPLSIQRQSIAGDIDIFGNVLSLGSLSNDPDAAGLTMSFSDNGTTASLSLALARPSSEWTWSHATTPGGSSAELMMKLDAANSLSLFDPANAGSAGIKLDPAGKSDFKADVSVQGTLRVQARGDLSMGSFTSGPQP